MNGNRRGRVLNRRVPDHLLAQRQVPIIPRVSLGLALPCQTLRAPLCRREAWGRFAFFSDAESRVVFAPRFPVVPVGPERPLPVRVLPPRHHESCACSVR